MLSDRILLVDHDWHKSIISEAMMLFKKSGLLNWTLVGKNRKMKCEDVCVGDYVRDTKDGQTRRARLIITNLSLGTLMYSTSQ